MSNRLLLKLLTIAGLSLLLLVPLWLIEAQIGARSVREQQVLAEIAESSAGAQTLLGPVCTVRYHELVERREQQEGSGREEVHQEVVERVGVYAPARLDVRGEARVETRKRGLYHARVFKLASQVSGEARLAPGLGLDAHRRILDAEAFLDLGIADPRGIGNDPVVTVNGNALHFTAGTVGLGGRPGAHVSLGPIDIGKGAQYAFGFDLALMGSDRLSIAPAGDKTSVAIKSDWPDPSFQGRFLPTTRSIDKSGFHANWEIAPLARSFDEVLRAVPPGAPGEMLTIGFLEPVNVYLMSERAVKYGILFVVLTFAGFFLTEVLRRLAVHPLQYLLVGLALALFFLLLISLSEHVRFELAYAIAATACALLIGVYVAGALRARRLGAAFGAGIGLLYAVLYGVLQSEDNALLLGSLLLFAALGGTMMLTRKVDWYRFGQGPESPPRAGPAGASQDALPAA